ncbi:hypothetical protein N0V88_007422 [Collariella sp. IMI 366227]|nr:hypothetical protein N0V88_007422 [Collariella sp. IMI 366227]
MGPASFMWPPDRAWSQAMDNIAPCGSIAGVVNRTAFPITGGKIALTAQDDSYNTQISISFNNNPQSQSDFTPLVTSPIPELNPGHTCLSLPQFTVTGTNATIQLVYTADFDRPENQTFYACADITFVVADTFNPATVPCFNATDDVNDVPAPTATGLPTGTALPGHGESGPPLTQPGTDDGEDKKGGLSKGGIAGVVVGCVVGVAVVLGLGLLWYRERARKERLVRERDAGRTVPWSESGQKTVGKTGPIRLGDMP